MLKDLKASTASADIFRKRCVISTDFYKHKTQYGVLEMFDAWRLWGLEGDNGRLKKLRTTAMRDKAILKDIATKNGSAPC